MKSNQIIIKLFILPIILIIAGCGGSKDNPTPAAPGKSSPTLPAQNAACTIGIVTSSTQSTVTFSWTASDNTDSYELNIKNLLTAVITTQTAATNQLAVTLLRNTPYSWYIISKNKTSTTSTPSDVWKFYNAGPSTTSHPPFPADVVAPTFGQNISATGGNIKLAWTGSDVDGDITSYDVYFGTNNTPAVLKSGLTDMFYSVSVTSGTTYYWKIVTKDSQGNTSDSGIFQFTVN